MKQSKAYSLRTAEAVARYGKAAWHPLCQAALALFTLDAESSKVEKNAVWAKEFLDTAARRKKEAKALLDQFYDKGMQKEAIRAAGLWNKTDQLLQKVRRVYPPLVKGLAVLGDMRLYLAGHFGRELLAAERAKNTSALRALSRVQKRWKALSNGARLRNNELRVLGMVQLLHDKAIRAAVWTKDGAVAGYLEAGRGGERPLSDEFWQGRLTVREIHSHLEATYGPGVAGDKEGKEVRRTLRALGIQEAEDQRGRKRKVPGTAKQKPKRQVGRPRTTPEIVPAGDTEGAEGIQRSIFGHRVNTKGHVLPKYSHRGKFKDGSGNTSYGGLSSLVEGARKISANIESEIRRLRMARGAGKGLYVYEDE